LLSSSVPATTDRASLPLHDALPISACGYVVIAGTPADSPGPLATAFGFVKPADRNWFYVLARCNLDGDAAVDSYYFASSVDPTRSEEHTSELQSRENLVCRLLLEKK